MNSLFLRDPLGISTEIIEDCLEAVTRGASKLGEFATPSAALRKENKT
jgi:hypothetical protein